MSDLDKTATDLQAKLDAFQVEELESRLEMSGWLSEYNNSCQASDPVETDD